LASLTGMAVGDTLQLEEQPLERRSHFWRIVLRVLLEGSGDRAQFRVTVSSCGALEPVCIHCQVRRIAAFHSVKQFAANQRQSLVKGVEKLCKIGIGRIGGANWMSRSGGSHWMIGRKMRETGEARLNSKSTEEKVKATTSAAYVRELYALFVITAFLRIITRTYTALKWQPKLLRQTTTPPFVAIFEPACYLWADLYSG
jgi:hypothetical protein